MLSELPQIKFIDEPTMHSNLADRERYLIPKHRFYIPTHIKEDNLEPIVHGLRKLAQEKPGAEVLVEVNTTGGDIAATTELALVMHHSPLRIRTLVTNKAYSAGTVIAAAGVKGYRFAYPEADFLVHRPTYTVNGKFTLTELQEYLNKKARAESRFTSLLSALTGNSQDRILDLFNNGDNFMGAEEAKSLGIVDHIIPDLKSTE